MLLLLCGQVVDMDLFLGGRRRWSAMVRETRGSGVAGIERTPDSTRRKNENEEAKRRRRKTTRRERETVMLGESFLPWFLFQFSLSCVAIQTFCAHGDRTHREKEEGEREKLERGWNTEEREKIKAK